MYTFLLALILLSSGVLVLAVLAQNPKGGGLSSAFGGSEASQFMGVKKTTDLLEKVTWGAASLIMLLSIAANVLVIPEQAASDPSALSPNVNKAQEIPAFRDEEPSDFAKEEALDLSIDSSDLSELPLDFDLEEE